MSYSDTVAMRIETMATILGEGIASAEASMVSGGFAWYYFSAMYRSGQFADHRAAMAYQAYVNAAAAREISRRWEEMLEDYFAFVAREEANHPIVNL